MGEEAAHRQHREHHVVVVDEEDELLLAVGKFCRHAQDKVLHLRLQSQQTAINLEPMQAGRNGNPN